MGCEVVALVVPGGRHAPLDWNSYCVHELAHNTLLFLFVIFTNNCCFSIKVYHVLLCMSRNTGQINPAGFQSLKYMYYTHVIMTIKWFLPLTLTFDMVCQWKQQQHLKLSDWTFYKCHDIWSILLVLGLVLLLRHEAVARIVTNKSTAILESCAVVCWKACDSVRSLLYDRALF